MAAAGQQSRSEVNREPIRITRERLYELVWSKTLRAIAAELDTAYVQLIAACKTMNVPRPPAGHWQAVYLGEQAIQVPLPEEEPGAPVEAFLNKACDQTCRGSQTGAPRPHSRAVTERRFWARVISASLQVPPDRTAK